MPRLPPAAVDFTGRRQEKQQPPAAADVTDWSIMASRISKYCRDRVDPIERYDPI
jgi:hypothetical protein